MFGTKDYAKAKKIIIGGLPRYHKVDSSRLINQLYAIETFQAGQKTEFIFYDRKEMSAYFKKIRRALSDYIVFKDLVSEFKGP